MTNQQDPNVERAIVATAATIAGLYHLYVRRGEQVQSATGAAVQSLTLLRQEHGQAAVEEVLNRAARAQRDNPWLWLATLREQVAV